MKKYKYLLSMIVLGVLFTSCSDNWFDVNEDPNNPTQVSPNLVLPVALNYSTNSISSYKGMGRGANTIGNMMVNNWSQSDGYSWYQDEFEYSVTSSFYTTIWDFTYRNTLKQYNNLDVDNANYENYRAIAKIMKSLHFEMLVDFYGDIPYFDALQRGDNTTPKYDNAQVIYEDLIVQLDNAISLINDGALNINVLVPSNDDTMFAGDMLKWKKLANTIKLRILVRQSDMSGRAAYLADEFAKIEADGSGFILEDATSNPGYTNEQNKLNSFWSNYGFETDGSELNNHKATCATQYVIDKLTSTGDPRINFIYALPTGGGSHKGVAQGTVNYPDGYTSEFVSLIGTGLLKSPGQDGVIFSLADAYLLQAEAQFKGLLSGDSKTSFESGVQASFNYLGAPGAGSYLSSGINLADYDASSNKLEAIIYQKWVGLNGIDASQSWFDWSRTGYPSDLPVSLQASTPNRPVRLHYPESEANYNSSNLPAQPDVFNTKIFWAN